MNPIIFRGSALLLAISFLALNITRVGAFNVARDPLEPSAAVSDNIQHQVIARKLDPKAEILSKYLVKQDSPLQDHAQDLIDAANEYGLDWKLVAAISGVESTFGKFTPGGYNGWGWGVYGNQAIYFKSWREAIFAVSQGLKQNYIDRGLINPYQMNTAYAASPYWGSKVTFFMNDLDNFAKSYESPEQVSEIVAPATKVAATSGRLANLN